MLNVAPQPSPEQSAVIYSNERSILCVASPGAGKTATLINRVKRLLDEFTDPALITVLTYTNAAANEIQSRLGAVKLGFCGTLHSYCYRLLIKGRVFADRISVIGEEQRDVILRNCIDRLAYRGTLESLAEQIALGPYAPAGRTQAELVAKEFYATLAQAGLVTFDSILHHALHVLRTAPPADNCGHLLIDEAQDSSDIDFAIYDLLPFRNKFVVADPDQGIYSFRGGNVQNIVSYALRRGTVSFPLQANYRSGWAICEAAQRLIEHNLTRIPKQMFSAAGRPGEVRFSGPFETPCKEVIVLGQRISSLPADESVAVLVRSNYLANQFSDQLGAMGVPVAKTHVAMPPDWARTRKLLSLIENPDNDQLAYLWIENEQGKAAADKALRVALEQFSTINQTHAIFIPAETICDTLAAYSASPESIALVKATADTVPTVSVSDLILALAGAKPEANVTPGAVVTTIHSAKGKEFDHVFLPAFEDGIIPAGNDIEEERRLAYVAVTRARRSVTISCAKWRKPEWGFNNEQKRPSIFAAEMGFIV